LVDVVRGKRVSDALAWLTTYPVKRAEPIRKMIQSAAANAKSRENVAVDDLIVKEIRVDQGPTIRYFKPGAMGRSNIQRKRLSHMSVLVESKGSKKVMPKADAVDIKKPSASKKSVAGSMRSATAKKTGTSKNKLNKED
jgi:large subunit ribosomal protein L22